MSKSVVRTFVTAVAAMLGMSVALPAQTFTSLYSFTPQGGTGYRPIAGVIVGPQGQLYGTTFYGGAYTYGTVYELAPPGSPGGAWTKTVLHSFGDQNGDVYPHAGVTLGPGGALYGVTEAGSSSTLPFTNGTVYQLRPPSGTSTHWPESVLHQFTGADGQNPLPSLVAGPGNAIFGATAAGTDPTTYGGTVFRLTAPSAAGGEWSLTTLWDFSMVGGVDGPQGTLAIYGDRIYGTTKDGGTGAVGAVFELTPPTVEGGSWTENTIYNFTAENGDGSTPYAGVVVDANGVLYGTTEAGGLPDQNCAHGFCGIAFSLAPPSLSGVTWTETILHSFTGENGDGATPYAGVILGPDGVLYGTTAAGGSIQNQSCGAGCGIVYELVPPPSQGGTWTEVVLHNFNGADGNEPYAGLVLANGTLYGTTAYGGASNQGTVFSVVP